MMKNHIITAAVDWMHHIASDAILLSDSRAISSDHAKTSFFFAYPGIQADGRRYIEDAIARGAKAVIYEAENFEWNPVWHVPHLAVEGLKSQVGTISSAYFSDPSRDMFTIAVTGTNGKTSCSQWIASALSFAGQRSGAIGTNGVQIFKNGLASQFAETENTTPDAIVLQKSLADLRDKQVSALAIEASSIGLEQGRMRGMNVDVALFTNFTRDHLDYHGDEAAYAQAKKILFDWPNLKHAVINLDDPMGYAFAEEYRENKVVIGYSMNQVSLGNLPVLQASAVRVRPSGTEFQIDSPYGSAKLKTKLYGAFNVSNILGVIGVLLVNNTPWPLAIDAVKKLTPVVGRMQKFGGKDTPMVIVDYAHTPDALAKAIDALTPVAQARDGKLWCAFGCGGGRDEGKRPLMGQAAEQADYVMLTNDNPRDESPEQIVAQIASGMTQAPQVLYDRAAAILSVVKKASKKDVILLAGKGHERYQEVGGVKRPFVDAEHVLLALAARATMDREGA